MNYLDDFITDFCIIQETQKEKSSLLYNAFCVYLKSKGQKRKISNKMFTRYFLDQILSNRDPYKDIKIIRTTVGTIYLGICLTDNYKSSDESELDEIMADKLNIDDSMLGLMKSKGCISYIYHENGHVNWLESIYLTISNLKKISHDLKTPEMQSPALATIKLNFIRYKPKSVRPAAKDTGATDSSSSLSASPAAIDTGAIDSPSVSASPSANVAADTSGSQSANMVKDASLSESPSVNNSSNVSLTNSPQIQIARKNNTGLYTTLHELTKAHNCNNGRNACLTTRSRNRLLKALMEYVVPDDKDYPITESDIAIMRLIIVSLNILKSDCKLSDEERKHLSGLREKINGFLES